jgi:hypothetical protein
MGGRIDRVSLAGVSGFLLTVNKQNVYNDSMIQSFACKETERFFIPANQSGFRGIFFHELPCV